MLSWVLIAATMVYHMVAACVALWFGVVAENGSMWLAVDC